MIHFNVLNRHTETAGWRLELTLFLPLQIAEGVGMNNILVLLVIDYHIYSYVVLEGVNLKRTFGKITGEDILNKMYEVFRKHCINYTQKNAWPCAQME